ncbi:MAG: aspartate aminotransferase family protein [Lachnospiraceae bacterium]|nr:aspartate aminotransferase family protein [Lachnospiraceae bacterium]
MNKQDYINQLEGSYLHVYNRYDVVLDHGDGVYLYDTDGKEYLDFTSGIAVMAFGYNNKEYNDALKAQIDKLIHTSNYYYNAPIASAGEALVKASGMDRVFFTNSGAEAIEGALKAAKKHAYLKRGADDYEIIAMDHSFHGRTIGALSVTGTEHYREPFYPLMPGVKFATFNDFDSVKALVTDKTCAIIMETIQGEGGIFPADPEFLKSVRALCDEKDIVLILDEIQCGMGRSGHMYAWQGCGVKPDIMTTAKALGCGVPVGAFAMTKEMAESSLVAGDHGTTYGGNPLVGAAVTKVFEMMERDGIISHVNEVGAYLFEKLDEFMAKHKDKITAHRGMGLIQGIEVPGKAGEIVKKALENGLVLITAGTDVIRFVPPLVIEKSDVDEMLIRLEKCFSVI